VKIFLTVLALVGTSGCLPEIRIGANEGLPPIGGTTEVSTDGFVCGEPITTGAGSATTRKVPGGCELTLAEEIQVIDEPDYARISDLAGFSGLIEAVELQLTEFSFIDSTTDTPLDLATGVTSATLAINGQQVADKTTLMSLPQTLRLTGPGLQPLKDAIYQRQPASLQLSAVVVLPDEPAPPKGLRLQYQAQPTIVVGGSL
jgi:hypothetical protein